MIQLKQISKVFGTLHALQHVDLQVSAGTIHGIVGENGAGKSTLMKILTGFQARSGGTIRIHGVPRRLATPAEARQLGIGMLYQEPLDFPQLTVLENFIGGSPHYSPAEHRAELASLCNQFNFHIEPHHRVEQLTVGERQQLELLRLIRNKVEILILDEPTTGISTRQQEQLFLALNCLRDEGKAILLVSHKLEEIDQLCDRVSVLRQGRIVLDTTLPFDRTEILEAMFGTLPTTRKQNHSTAGKDHCLVFSNVTVPGARSGLKIDHLEIKSGEVVGLAGVDGSGQSLFLRICGGLQEVSSGTVHRFNEISPGHKARLDPRIAFLPADRLGEGLFPDMTIREHHILGTSKEWLLSRTSGLAEAKSGIDTFGILGNPESRAAHLSGGNQQRLLLSLISPLVKLLLLESPTRGLDVRSAQWTWQQLHQQKGSDGTILFASPDLDEILSQATRVLVFFEGRIVLDRSTRDTSTTLLARAITGEVGV